MAERWLETSSPGEPELFGPRIQAPIFLTTSAAVSLARIRQIPQNFVPGAFSPV